MTKRVAEVKATYSISFRTDYRSFKRPKFEDVVRELWGQLDDLGHDLDGALLVAPRGATPRQCSLALNEIRKQQGESRLR
jgi:hypothetical protein